MGYQNPLLQTERHSVIFIDVIYPLLLLNNDKAKPKGGQNELLIFLSSPESVSSEPAPFCRQLSVLLYTPLTVKASYLICHFEGCVE